MCGNLHVFLSSGGSLPCLQESFANLFRLLAIYLLARDYLKHFLVPCYHTIILLRATTVCIN